MANQQDEEGCFVYRMLQSVAVRSALNVGDECRTGLSFNKDDLISVDLIRPSRTPGSNNGPFLRLSDCSGWLFEHKYGEKMMERLTVTEGLWAMYADNCNTGIGLRNHPFDNSPMIEPSTTYYGFHDRCFFSTGDLFCSQGGAKYYHTSISTKDLREQEG